ncbi:unnamed protein product, partial [Pylaiella littoralis]
STVNRRKSTVILQDRRKSTVILRYRQKSTVKNTKYREPPKKYRHFAKPSKKYRQITEYRQPQKVVPSKKRIPSFCKPSRFVSVKKTGTEDYPE